MQVPTQPPQVLVEIAKRHIREHLAAYPGYRATAHRLVDDGIVDRYEGADGCPLDVSIAAIDDLGAEDVLQQVDSDTFILRQPPAF
jgi:hypothetical protein